MRDEKLITLKPGGCVNVARPKVLGENAMREPLPVKEINARDLINRSSIDILEHHRTSRINPSVLR